jgi:hypothetical protein
MPIPSIADSHGSFPLDGHDMREMMTAAVVERKAGL